MNKPIDQNQFLHGSKAVTGLMRIAVVLLVVTICGFSSSINAEAKNKTSKTDEPPAMIDGLPANWDFYAIDEAVIDKYSGEERDDICFGEDFDGTPNNYEVLKISSNYRKLRGVKDFVVLDKKHLLISTPETGASVIKTKFCKKFLRRAKFVLINENAAARCVWKRRGLTIMTRLKNVTTSCEVASIHNWTGPVESTVLKEESKALKDSVFLEVK